MDRARIPAEWLLQLEAEYFLLTHPGSRGSPPRQWSDGGGAEGWPSSAGRDTGCRHVLTPHADGRG
jgi:hypothetical protein